MRSLLIKIFRPFAPLARKILGGPLFRSLRETLFATRKYDEVEVIFKAIASYFGDKGMMIDVGAHRGESFEAFSDAGWTVHCFEPNPANHARIKAKIRSTRGQVQLFDQAVSDKPEQGLAFYTSDQSTGISSLHAFHDTHQSMFKVNAITLSDHIKKQNINSIDFLKIDTEGFDFFVLKGIDWKGVTPNVILAEFEDSKTQGLNYNYRDMGNFLVSNGYEVIVSEWYPIAEYGQQHQWRRYCEYPCRLEDDRAWGNLIAMRPGKISRRIRDELSKIARVEVGEDL